MNEAWEEAGLKGRLIGEALGTFEDQKWNHDLVVAVYLMEVTEEYDDYEEAHFRDRTWWSLTEAATKLAKHPVLAAAGGRASQTQRTHRRT